MDYAAIADRATVIIGSADPAQFQLAFDTMVAETEVVDRATIPSTEILGIILNNRAEWEAMTEPQRQVIRDILTVYDSVPTTSGAPARDTLVALLGTATKQEIAADLTESVLVWPGLKSGIVKDALQQRVAGEV